MKREITFVARMHDDIGEVGWMPKGCGDAFEPLHYAPGLAHDTLEHINGLDTVADEIVAHGVMYWLRYETGYVGPWQYARAVDLDSIGSEFASLYRAIEWIGDSLSPAPVQEPLDETREEELADIIERGRQWIRDEQAPGDINEGTAELIASTYADWFRMGVHMAEEMYGKVGRNTVLGWFSELASFFQQSLRDIQEETEVTITLDLETGEMATSMGGMCGMCGCWVDEIETEYPLCEDCQEGY